MISTPMNICPLVTTLTGVLAASDAAGSVEPAGFLGLSAGTLGRLWSPLAALDHPVSRIVAGVVVAALALTPLATIALSAMGRLDPKTRADIWVRYRTWLVLAPAIIVPILLGAATTIAMICLVSLLCYREFARATGLFRERLISALVAIGIVLLALAALDHYPRFFHAIPAMGVALVAALAVLQDRPSGYIQRVSLGALGLLLFGASLAHYAFIANDPNFRPILCMLIFGVQAGDILAYVCGKAFGSRKAFPNTSPKKTLEGHIGSAALTVPLVMWLGHMTFAGTDMGGWLPLLALGLIVALGGQVGDLILSSIKRDLGLKDLAVTLPGHGGFSDRFNSSLLVAPAAYHLINYTIGIGAGEAVRIFSGR